MAGRWTFDREGTRLASVEVAIDFWAFVVVDLRDGSSRRFKMARVQGEAYPMPPGTPLGWAATGELLLDTFYPFSEGGYAGVWALTLPGDCPSAAMSTLGRRELLARGSYFHRPQLSPDGTRLLYLASDPGYTPAGYLRSGGFEPPAVNQLWSLDLVGGRATRLVEVTDGGALASSIAWRPDGREALFAQGRYEDGWRLDGLTLWAVDAAGADRKIGTLPGGRWLRDLRWCRPGQALAVLYPDGEAMELHRVDLATSGTALVARGREISVLGIVEEPAGAK